MSDEFYSDLKLSEKISSTDYSIGSPFDMTDTITTGVKLEIKFTTKSIFNFTTRKDCFVVTVGVFLTAAAGACKPVIAIFLGHIFDELSDNAAAEFRGEGYDLMPKITPWILGLVGLGLATWLINSVFFGLWLLFGERQARAAREKIFTGMLEKDMEWYELQSDGVASLLVRIQSQVRELKIATSQPLGFFVEDIASFLVSLGIAMYTSWKLTLVICASVPVLMILAALATRKLESAVELQKAELSLASKASFSAASSIDTVKAYNSQQFEVLRFNSIIKRAASHYLVQARGNALQIGLVRVGSILMFVQGFWYGLTLVQDGFKSGTIITCFYSVLIAVESAEALMPQWLILTKGMSAGETLKHIVLQIENGRTIKPMQGQYKPPSCDGDVEVSNVSFSYPSTPGQLALDKTSFLFPAGETTFVIGRSGSGKSTLGNLLMKYYNPLSGEVLIEGQSIQTLDLEWLRNTVTFVQQQSVLFNETLFRNVAFGRKSHTTVTKQDIMEACRTAMLEQTIHDLPDGLDTHIGANGNDMSGGQKQRIAIARARLKNSSILILDEATSALDPTSRLLVMDAVREWRRNKTTIIITHDISQIRPQDFLYILDRGRIVQEGFREALEKVEDGAFITFLPPPREKKSDYDSDLFNIGDSTPVSAISNSASDMWGSQPVLELAPRGLRHLSNFLGVSEGSLTPQLGLNRRMSRGMGPMRLNELRAEKVWKSPVPDNSLGQFENTVRKPLPVHGSPVQYHAPRSLFNRPEDLKLVHRMGEETARSRAGAKKLDRQRRPETKEGMRNIVELISPRKPHFESPATEVSIQKKSMSTCQILSSAWPLFSWYDRLILIAGLFSALVNGASTPAFSYVLAQLLNVYYVLNDQAGQARKWALITIGVGIVDGVSSYAFHYLLERSGQTWVDYLRKNAMKRILSQPRSWFDKSKNDPSRLSETLDHNSEEMRNLLGRFSGYLTVASTMITIGVVWALAICWKLTLVAVSAGPVMFLCTNLFSRSSTNWEAQAEQRGDDVYSIFIETFSSIRTVRALTLENYFTDKHNVAIRLAYQVGKKRALHTGFWFGLSDSTNSFVTALVLYYGALLYSQAAYSLPDVLLTITLLLFSFGNATTAMGFIPQISQSKQTAERMIKLSHMTEFPAFEHSGVKHIATMFPVRFTNLKFSYPSRPTAKILSGLTLRFDSGTCTALVGASGSGKSTIATLLLGLYPPNEASYQPTPSLTFNGTSIFHVHMHHLRSKIAIVPQTPVLFPTTIKANITYGLAPGSPQHSTSHVIRAATDAGIHDYIMSLPSAYETLIGDGGQGLSGGQAQRVSIARALIREPQLLILDEATSALDVESARIIRQTIQRLIYSSEPADDDTNVPPGTASSCGGRQDARASSRHDDTQRTAERKSGMSIVLITHSIDMMKIAQRIVVLEKGRVAEEGSWRELAHAGGAFEKLIREGDCC